MAGAASIDALSGLAPLLRVRPELKYICRLGDQWASAHSPERGPWAPFHIVMGGPCRLNLTRPDQSIPLETGDVAVLPHGSAHIIHSPTTSPRAIGPFGIESRLNGAILIKSNTDAAPDAELICGRLRFDQASPNLILSALPKVIVVPAAAGRDAVHLKRLIKLIKDELESARPGAPAIAQDAASALLVMVVRVHVETARESESLLALLGHPQAGRVVAAMVEKPARPWTLDEMAGLANTSRASLVRNLP